MIRTQAYNMMHFLVTGCSQSENRRAVILTILFFPILYLKLD